MENIGVATKRGAKSSPHHKITREAMTQLPIPSIEAPCTNSIGLLILLALVAIFASSKVSEGVAHGRFCCAVFATAVDTSAVCVCSQSFIACPRPETIETSG